MQRKKKNKLNRARASNKMAARGFREGLSVGSMIVCRPETMNWKIGHIKPYKGAELTIRQVVPGSSFLTHTGITNDFATVPTTTGAPIDLAFSLSDLAQKASWEAVFDQYRIEKVDVHMIPLWNHIDGHSLSAGVNATNPPTHVVFDFDDSTSLASPTAALEYDHVQTIMPYDGLKISFRPKVTPALYAGGAFTGYGVDDSKAWMDIASDGIAHYGVKAWMNPTPATNTISLGWYVYAQYTVSFTNTR